MRAGTSDTGARRTGVGVGWYVLVKERKDGFQLPHSVDAQQTQLEGNPMFKNTGHA